MERIGPLVSRRTRLPRTQEMDDTAPRYREFLASEVVLPNDTSKSNAKALTQRRKGDEGGRERHDYDPPRNLQPATLALLKKGHSVAHRGGCKSKIGILGGSIPKTLLLMG